MKIQWMRERRAFCCAGIPAAFFALMTVLGTQMRTAGALVWPIWKRTLLFLVWLLVYGAALYGVMHLNSRKRTEKYSRFSRIVSSWIVVFVLLVLCWLPAWLAFWPGSFSPDSITQFYAYYNEDHSAHHPLLHTLLLGFCMVLGIDASPEGYATGGLALYCGIQLVLTAGCVAAAVSWMRRRGVPLRIRLIITLFYMLNPFYAPWSFYSQKDVLFGALVLLFCLQLVDLWKFGMKPLRVSCFVVIAVLMMLMRNNGIYALALLLPFAIWWMKGRRIRMAALLAGCMALYLAANAGLMYALDASEGSKVEILSVPLQQIARTLRENPQARELDEEGVLDTLFGEADIIRLYDERIADPLKWNVDYEALDENIPALLKLWFRMGVRNADTYVEAFVAQNLPYLLPYSEMFQTFDFGIQQPEWFPIEETNWLPGLREAYETYEETLVFQGVPGTHLLCDPAVYVWLCIGGFALAFQRRNRGLMTAFGFLITVWLTCLLGPVAIMRYLLGVYYTVPVLLGSLCIGEPKDISYAETKL